MAEMQVTIHKLSGENPVTVTAQPDAQVQVLLNHISVPPFTNVHFFLGATELGKAKRLGDVGVQDGSILNMTKSPNPDAALSALDSQSTETISSALDFLTEHVKVCELERRQVDTLLKVAPKLSQVGGLPNEPRFNAAQRAARVLGHGANLRTCGSRTMKALHSSLGLRFGTGLPGWKYGPAFLDAVLSKHSEDTLRTHMHDCGDEVISYLKKAEPYIRCGHGVVGVEAASVLARFAVITCDGARLRVAKDVVTGMRNVLIRRKRCKDVLQGMARSDPKAEQGFVLLSEAWDALERSVAELRRVDHDDREWTFSQIAARHAESLSEEEIRDYWGNMQKLPQEQSTDPAVAAIPTNAQKEDIQQRGSPSTEHMPMSAAAADDGAPADGGSEHPRGQDVHQAARAATHLRTAAPTDVGESTDEGAELALAPGEQGIEATDPRVQEQRDLTEALLRSKSEALSADEVVIFRLTCFSDMISAVLMTSPSLDAPRTVVADAGCQVRPAFSPATFLVPITVEHYSELGLDLRVYHILARRQERESILQALREVPAAKRPKVKDEDRDYLEPLQHVSHELQDHALAVITNVDLIEENIVHGFIHFRTTISISEVSSDKICHSAPSGPAGKHVEPCNMRKFKMCS